MLRNLLRVAFRNLKRDKWYNFLNILGLTIGITFGLFLIFYIKDELSYDRYNEKAARIYRISSYIKEPEKETMKWAITQNPLATALQKDYPEIEECVRLQGAGRTMFKNGDRRFYENKIYYADSNLLRVFTYPLLDGDTRTALQAPNSIVLTQTLAEKFFGKTPAVGKTLQNDKGEVFNITGVMKDVPKNSHLIFTMLISGSTIAKYQRPDWGNFDGTYTYVLLKPNTSAAAFEKKLAPMYDKYMAVIFAQYNIKIQYGLQSLTAIHLHSDMANEPEELGSMSYVYIFSAVALFMLLIACINYMNLTTARSARRAREIGIRKVTGSTKFQLVAQFLAESTLTALLALILSIGLIALFLPTFNMLSGKSISLRSLLEPGTILLLLGVVLGVGLLGGSYPAFYLSKFNPVDVLKGSLSKSSSNIMLRRILVVIQFSISMIMLICTWVVNGQLNFLRHKDLGFNQQQVVSLRADAKNYVGDKITAFKNSLRQDPQVLSVSTAWTTPGGEGMNFSLFKIETKNGMVDKAIDNYGIDEDYLKTLGIQLIAGRNFKGPSDTLRSAIVNESMAKYFGWGDNALGKRIRYPEDSIHTFEVVGVIKDFNQKSLYNPIAPLMLFYSVYNRSIQLKLAPNNVTASLATIEKSWKTYLPDLPFSYTFLDQDFFSQYAADQKRGKIFTSFSVLTILITSLGLLGLIAFTTEQRQKEISIRKIMGAKVTEIIPLITTNFVVLVGLSCLIAFPVAWLFMDKWLQIFPYNTGLGPAPFLLSALTVLLITLLTVTFHTVKAAIANPSKSLRTE